MKFGRISLVSTLLFEFLLFIIGVSMLTDSSQASMVFLLSLSFFIPILLFFYLLNFLSVKFSFFRKLINQYIIGTVVALIIVVCAFAQSENYEIETLELIEGVLVIFLICFAGISINYYVKRIYKSPY